MTISENELAAYADGQLTAADAARVEKAIAADPALARQLAIHRQLRERLSAHFAPILAQDPPEHLTALLRPQPEVADLAAARAARTNRPSVARWAWLVGPALAASLLIAVLLPQGDGGSASTYAAAELALMLDNQLVAEQDPQSRTRVLLSFKNDEGSYCRAYTSVQQSGIACHDGGGWAIVEQAGGANGGGGEYQQAGSSLADILGSAQDMAIGEALDDAAEQVAREQGWRD